MDGCKWIYSVLSTLTRTKLNNGNETSILREYVRSPEKNRDSLVIYGQFSTSYRILLSIWKSHLQMDKKNKKTLGRYSSKWQVALYRTPSTSAVFYLPCIVFNHWKQKVNWSLFAAESWRSFIDNAHTRQLRLGVNCALSCTRCVIVWKSIKRPVIVTDGCSRRHRP